MDTMHAHSCFTDELSEIIWDSKYRYRDGEIIHDQTITDSWKRIATALASANHKIRNTG